MSDQANTRELGPVQMLVLGFAEPDFTGAIAAELDRLRQLDFIRIVDALVVEKDDAGDIAALQVSDLAPDEATEMGAVIGALIGYAEGGDDEAVIEGAVAGAAAMEDGHLIPDEEVWYVADAIPAESADAREAVRSQDGACRRTVPPTRRCAGHFKQGR
jgi:uncharacterized membrane protein